MEKEKSDGASPRGVLEACMSCSGSDTPSPMQNNEESRPVNCTGSKKLSQWGKLFKMWKGRSIKHLASLNPLTTSKMSKRKSRSEKEEIPPVLSEIYDFKSTLEHFSLSDLAAATNNFSPGLKVKLDWSKRYKIALGTANGLVYLHESCQKRIIHRDIKADNILLTADFEPQICDFGLAKWLPKQWSHYNVSKFEGTFGYFAPEYFMHGIVDEKTDVYAFGVLLLELITGRQALDHEQRSVVLWAKPLLDENAVRDLIDPSLDSEYNLEEMDRVIMTATLCIEQSPILRPRMNQVVVLLKGDNPAAEDTEECRRRSIQRTYSDELLDAQEYNSTRYLSDLRRHREVALGS